jgi:hypothetical protein
VSGNRPGYASSKMSSMWNSESQGRPTVVRIREARRRGGVRALMREGSTEDVVDVEEVVEEAVDGREEEGKIQSWNRGWISPWRVGGEFMGVPGGASVGCHAKMR